MSTIETNTLTGRAAAGLVANLRENIVSGELSPGEFLPSVRVLSSEHGIAPQTVHRALKSLAAEKLIVAEPRQGYRVLPRAASEPTAPIACVFNTAGDEAGWGRVLSAVFQRAAGRKGLPLLALPANPDDVPGLAEQLRVAKPQGILLNTSDPQVLDAVTHSGIPAVMFDAWRPGSGFDSVLQDSFEGAMQAAQYLAKNGHTRVAWLGPQTAGADPQIVERYAGAVAGLAHAGLDLAPEFRIEADDEDREDIRSSSRELLSRSARPTAVMTLWYPMAEGLLTAARELGLRVGEDFEMVGWVPEEHYDADYRPMFADNRVAPAIVWQVSELVETALRRLEERIAHPAMTPLQMKIPTRLRVPRPKGEQS